MRVCVGGCMRACVRLFRCACVCLGVRACVRPCVLRACCVYVCVYAPVSIACLASHNNGRRSDRVQETQCTTN